MRLGGDVEKRLVLERFIRCRNDAGFIVESFHLGGTVAGSLLSLLVK